MKKVSALEKKLGGEPEENKNSKGKTCRVFVRSTTGQTRRRAGLEFGVQAKEVEVSEKQLEQLLEDEHLEVKKGKK